MTTSLFRNPKGLPNEVRLGKSGADGNLSRAERCEMNATGSGNVRKEMTRSEKGDWYALSSRNMLVVLLALALISPGCRKLHDDFFDDISFPGTGHFANYVQTNLVSDTAVFNANILDATLVNAWGIAINPTGVFWINANGSDGSEVWDMNGVPKRAPVGVPSPSGIIFNSTTDFIIPATGTVSRFIFASENGKIYAWSSGDTARTVVDRSASNAVYKGIELAKDGTDNFLYATDFHNRKIDVFDKSFNLVTTKPFMDTKIPNDFGPFNIRLIDNLLYVTYAKQLAPDNHDDMKGPGNGYVNVFKTDGSLMTRFATRGKLNSPWGIEKAPQGFGFAKDVILIGNFGDGHINVYSQKEGEFLTPLENKGKPLMIDGLWAITFPDNNVPGDDPDKLYFTAGPFEESHGLFGYLLKQ